jgi:hypothetical protein
LFCPRQAACSFHVDGLRPEFWTPETGEIEPVAVYEQAEGPRLALEAALPG